MIEAGEVFQRRRIDTGRLLHFVFQRTVIEESLEYMKDEKTKHKNDIIILRAGLQMYRTRGLRI